MLILTPVHMHGNAVETEPDHVRAQNNKRYYEQMLMEEAAERRKGDEGDAPPEFKNQRILDDYRASEEFMTYEALCRGEETHVSLLHVLFVL